MHKKMSIHRNKWEIYEKEAYKIIKKKFLKNNTNSSLFLKCCLFVRFVKRICGKNEKNKYLDIDCAQKQDTNMFCEEKIKSTARKDSLRAAPFYYKQ